MTQVKSPSATKPTLPQTLLHELGHVAGFQHTFQREDRDAYVTPWHHIPAAVSGTISNVPRNTAECMVMRHEQCLKTIAQYWGTETAAPYKAACQRAVNGLGGLTNTLLRAYPIDSKVQEGAFTGKAHYLSSPDSATTIDDGEYKLCSVGVCVFKGVQSDNNFEIYTAKAGYKQIAEYDYQSVMVRCRRTLLFLI